MTSAQVFRTASAVVLMAACFATEAAPRSSAAKAEFKRANPCPAGSAHRGCPGYIVDHVEPLCAGGADAAHNMQWQTIEQAKAKDRDEVRLCRSLRRGATRQR